MVLTKLLAQDVRLIPNAGIAHDVSSLNIVNLIPAMVNLLFVAAVIIFFFMLVIGGVRWISSGGDKTRVENAKKQIVSAIVGLFITLCAFAIVSIIEIFFDVNIISGLNLTGSGNEDGDVVSYSCSPGWCECYNNMGCVPDGTLGPISPGGTCYTCNSGTWGSPTYPPEDPGCEYAIHCDPYP